MRTLSATTIELPGMGRLTMVRRVLIAVAVAVAALASPASASAAPAFEVLQDHTHRLSVVTGDLELMASVKNAGDSATTGSYEVRYDLPGVLTPLSIAGTGWTCDLPTLSCTRSAAVAPGARAPIVTVIVDIGAGAPTHLQSIVTASGGGATTVNDAAPVLTEPVFDAKQFTTSALDATGADETRAGATPFSASATFGMMATRRSTAGLIEPIDEVRTIVTDLPPGFVGNPQVVAECPSLELVASRGCPLDSLVGFARLRLANTGATSLDFTAEGARQAVYNLTPTRGHAASFGITVGTVPVRLNASVRTDSDFGVTVTTFSPQGPALVHAELTLCGHGVGYDDGFLPPITRTYGPCLGATDAGAFPQPFLSNPVDCTVPSPTTVLTVDSWEDPEVKKGYRYGSPQVTDCDALEFDPVVHVAPLTTLPDSATGLAVDMSFPHNTELDGLATPALKKAVVTLPEGMTINPAGANGLAACSDAELNLKSKAPVTCPDAAKVGTVTATSPLLKETLSGGVYIRSQNSSDPESGEMFRLALVLENEERGLSIRLPGQVRADRASGRLVTTFDNNPQLPVSDIKLRFKDGPTAPLMTPSTCGSKAIDTVLTSWGGQTKTLQSTFNVDCANGMGGFAPGFEAGTQSPAAGASSPFSLRVARQAGDKELKSIKSIRLPEGLLGRVASVPLCDEVQAAAGTCSEASRVGHVQVAAGAGPLPLWVPQAGREPTGVYLTGPYNGAPYGLSIKVPAQAGPFDLGRVVVRSALHVDERTAAITSGVDETRLIDPNGTATEVLPGDLPRIIKGVVLNQREIRVIVDREDFMVNPTDCSQQRIKAEIYAYGGGKADVGNRFRAVECANLGFKPRFNARILDKGRRSTLRSWHPRTRFTVVPRKGDANIGGARVALPSSTILDQSNIGTTCTRAQMAERACPAKSVVGYAKAWSPLLRKAVEGPVYLAANGGVRPLPDLAAVLDGEIRVVLQGDISTLRTSGKARLQNTFRVVPDAPVSRFVLTMRGGKNTGLLVNSTDLCRTNERGVTVFAGQNGRQHRLGLRLTPSFRGCAKVRRQAARRVAARKAAVRKAVRNVG